MLSRITALVVRSLRCEARAWQPHLLRTGLVAAVLLILIFQVVEFSRYRSASGHDLLAVLAWSGWVALGLLGLGHFATAITEEKEEGNLDLMRMAGLSPLAILLGKSSARLWEALVLVGSILPMSVLAVTLGGVSLDQVLAVTALLATWAVFLSGLGVLVSVVARSQATASALLLAAVFTCEFVPGIVYATVIRTGSTIETLVKPMTEMSTWYRLVEALSLGFAGGAVEAAVIAHLLLGVAAFLLAWRLFPRFGRDTVAGEGERGALGAGPRAWLPRPGRPRAGGWAQRWKDFHFVGGGWVLVAVRVLAMSALVALVSLSEYQLDAEDIGEISMATAFWWLVVDVGLMLSRVFSVEVRWQTWSGLAALPDGAGSAVLSKLVTVAVVTAPALVLLIVGGFLAPRPLDRLLSEMLREFWPLPIIAGIIVTFWYLCALLSLYVRYGAFFAAAGVLFGLGLLAGVLIAAIGINGRDAEHLLGILVVGGMSGLCVAMHLRFLRRWRELAAG